MMKTMFNFDDRPRLVPFCWFLALCVIGAFLAKILPGGWGRSSLICSIVFAWILLIRELNGISSLLPEKWKSWVQWCHAQTGEFFALLSLPLLSLKTRIFRRKAIGQPSNYKPILLVHGYLNSGFVWDFQKKWLEEQGFGPIYTIDLGNPFLSIRSYAEKVQKKIDQIAQDTGRPDITLIGHSMGGLISYYCVSKLARSGSVPQVITLASPLCGTKVAKIGLGRCAREMEIGSDLLQELHEGIQQCPGVRFYNLATKTDELVIPHTSSFLMSNPERQCLMEDIGHASLLFSRRVSNQIVEWLRCS
jgi:hypothetical protein